VHYRPVAVSTNPRPLSPRFLSLQKRTKTVEQILAKANRKKTSDAEYYVRRPAPM
jgi:hypothetical protein